ncbi:TetR/AcrR family transcriptional regulator [Qipengyuania qiaonensis]|uniref:TetR/AcrR family transcriptional regulator n=1 Tax=Qipengyuania qiaonensis TaxID=2867240 RepID=A0ABS7J2R9_9SPHN|nr:TetR/AcrR family transcriptional regulator [Qipengyuania qiaonensis]MBX7481613.1 TetR/AcrR family transcriptional regulator [Qipengyuania qiaonensis]
MPEKSYHHGELREALLNAALDLVRAEGPGALSLRRLAKAVGVSAMAPYHHFPDRGALLAAVATRGFEQLQESKLANHAAHHNLADALATGAANYCRFILDNPNLYRLMSDPALVERADDPHLIAAAQAPAAMLLQMVTQLFAECDVEDIAPRDGATMLWGIAHGLGTLAIDGQLTDPQAITLSEQGAAAMIRDWTRRGPSNRVGD